MEKRHQLNDTICRDARIWCNLHKGQCHEEIWWKRRTELVCLLLYHQGMCFQGFFIFDAGGGRALNLKVLQMYKSATVTLDGTTRTMEKWGTEISLRTALVPCLYVEGNSSQVPTGKIQSVERLEVCQSDHATRQATIAP